MKSKIIFLIITIFLCQAGFSQYQTKDLLETGFISGANKDGGTVNITQDDRLQTAVSNHIKANKYRPVYGWRVQIYFGTGQSARSSAERIKKSFLRDYSETRAYIIYEAPFFKVRVGDYRTKFEAAKMKKILETEYNTVFLVETEINIHNSGEVEDEDVE